MPELNARAIKKWVRDFGGIVPDIDFSNGVRVRDIAIDTSCTPNKIWICRDNTIGNPIWEEENIQSTKNLICGQHNYINIYSVSNTEQLLIAYMMNNNAVQHEGLLRIGYSDNEVTVDNEYGGKSPVESLVVTCSYSNGVLTIDFNLTDTVGDDMVLEYNTISKLTFR